MREISPLKSPKCADCSSIVSYTFRQIDSRPGTHCGFLATGNGFQMPYRQVDKRVVHIPDMLRRRFDVPKAPQFSPAKDDRKSDVPAQRKREPRRSSTSPQSQAAEKLSSSEPNPRVQLRYDTVMGGAEGNGKPQRGCHSPVFPRYSAVKLFVAQIRDDI